jgi:uncharacterized protein (DUF427 family)
MIRRLTGLPTPETPGPGQESVWDYPRPPRLEKTTRHIQVVLNGQVVADTRRALRLLETSHPPTYYIPPEDVRTDLLFPAPGDSLCEWKGSARYYTVRVREAVAARAAWSYPDPLPRFAALKDHIAFYASAMERCTVDGEAAKPQPGGFYGGWITDDLAGPFKGGPGSAGW